jgi:hypothetical protein
VALTDQPIDAAIEERYAAAATELMRVLEDVRQLSARGKQLVAVSGLPSVYAEDLEAMGNRAAQVEVRLGDHISNATEGE